MFRVHLSPISEQKAKVLYWDLACLVTCFVPSLISLIKYDRAWTEVALLQKSSRLYFDCEYYSSVPVGSSHISAIHWQYHVRAYCYLIITRAPDLWQTPVCYWKIGPPAPRTPATVNWEAKRIIIRLMWPPPSHDTKTIIQVSKSFIVLSVWSLHLVQPFAWKNRIRLRFRLRSMSCNVEICRTPLLMLWDEEMKVQMLDEEEGIWAFF